MSERPSPARALARHATTAVTSPPKHEPSYVGSSVRSREPCDQTGTVSSPDLLIHPEVHVPTHGCLNRDRVVSQIEDMAMDRGRDGAESSDHLPRDTAQVFVDVIDEALGLPDLPPQLRKNWTSTLYYICSRWGLLPRSLQIPLCYDRLQALAYSGGFADVWMGYYQGRRVAAKVLRIYLTSDLNKIRRSFCKEAIRWKALDHPNVLPLLGVTIDEGQFVMVSEWMENGTINEFIRSHTDVDLFELLKDVAKGLIYMHDEGMVHGDLKGDNILINGDGRACLADFGFLTAVSDPTNPTALSSYTVGGTIGWMSPELLIPDQTDLGRPTKQSDCYALGMVIYEVLSGQIPFAPFNRFVALRKVMDGECPQRPGGAEGERFTNDLWQVLVQCWATRPEDRPSCSAVLECLEQVSRNTRIPSPGVDGRFGVGWGVRDLTKRLSRAFSWFDLRRFITFLRRILC